MLGHRADVEECFGETFLAALRYSRTSTVRHWTGLLQRLATARAVDRLRFRYRQNSAITRDDSVPEASSDGPGPVDLAVAAELSSNLREALAKLPADQVEVFCLHALSGWSYDEIGRQIAMSSSAVGVTIHRVRKRLRELLGERAHPSDVKRGDR